MTAAHQAVRGGEVTIRDLSKSFTLNRAPLAVLRDLNLEIGAGEILAIVGPSGCGKTTLLRVLAGLETPDSGQVLIDGRPVEGVGTDRAVIFQEPRLLPRALAVQPEILLLDEPFGALDAMTKLTMQEELEGIWREERLTMILVTHDLEEAIFLADRVLVLSRGSVAAPRLIDVALPRPRDRSEAGFVAMRRRLMAEFGLH